MTVNRVARRLRSPLSCLAAACLAGVAMAAAAAPAPTTVHPSQWPSVKWPLPRDRALDQRVHALMAKMSLADKVGQIIQADINSVTPADVARYHLGSVLAGGDSAPGGKPFATAAQWLKLADAYYRASMHPNHGGVAIPVLFGIDAVHGHNNVIGATLFPQNVGLGAMRDPALMRRIGAATAEEVRATGINWAFGPTIAVVRDNRWGRSYEGYSENPALVARYAPAMVEGLQGVPGTPGFLDARHVIASAKHYLGDGFTHDGKDQGDAEVSETQLRTIANAGYPPAIAAGVQTIMTSFSSWNGVKMAANKGLVTDVLKDRMHFGGLVIDDWNAHGQIPGCSNEDCPQAINAGIDMIMAPDSWKGFYRHTLAEVKSGRIPMSRLNDAVARVLRVKLRMHLFSEGLPSRQAVGGHFDVIGSTAHRAVARQAVRESLVLLKNRHHLLPINPHQHVLVAGEGANSIPQQCGGWTLTWQGTGTTNADFPGATSIWQGIRQQVQAAGGTATLSVDGHYAHKPDVAIVVYGEEPYAEFRGDRPNLAYKPGNPHDLDLLRRLHAAGIPVVSVFLSGRPLWVNPEINASDAFVAAWLPGSEGEGVADVLLRRADGHVQFDFRGKLPYSWPRTAVQTPINVGDKHYDPQFAYGYGLTYADNGDLPQLPEFSGLKGAQGPAGVYLDRGHPVPGITMKLVGADGRVTTPGASAGRSADGSLTMQAFDRHAQEDARRLRWHGSGAALELDTGAPRDLQRETNGEMLLTLELRVHALATGHGNTLGLRCGKHCMAQVDIGPGLRALPRDTWLQVGVPLKCLRRAGANMRHIDAVVWRGGRGSDIDVTRMALGTDVAHVLSCHPR